MLTDYLKAAMAKAKYEIINDGSYYGEIPGFQGVWANARSLEGAREELREVLEEWLVISLQIGHKIPRLPGIRPFPKKMKIAG